MPRPRGRNDRILLALLCALFVTECALAINDTIMYSPDSVNYLAWAQSLAALKGFANTLGPSAEHYVFNAPLYPVLLAPVVGVFPGSVIAAKLATLAFGIATLVLFYLFLRRRLSQRAAWLTAAFLAINPLFILFSTQVLSDVPFGLCLVLTLILLEQSAETRERLSPSVIAMILTGCAAVFLREVGFALVFALAVCLALRRQTRPLLYLMAALALVYSAWFIRNEVIVARAENPGLRNISMVFSHVYTASGTSFASEIMSRVVRSAEFYGPALGNLIVAPFALRWTFSVTDSTDQVLLWMQNAMKDLAWPIGALTLAALLLGARRLLRGSAGMFLCVFLPAYALIIVIYPVSDVRFLFPVLLLMLWGVAEGCAALAEKSFWSRGGHLVAPICLIVLALPNLAWIRNVVTSNVSFRSDPEAFAQRAIRDDPYPNELLLIPRRASEWVALHSDSATVVASKSMATGLWLHGRPIVVINPLSPVEDFDNKIRDYHVAYLICSLQAHAVPDFLLQMAMSNKHRFISEVTFADVEVFRVLEKTSPAEPSFSLAPDDTHGLLAAYLSAVLSLRDGRSFEAVARFRAISRLPGLETSGLFYSAVSQEFNGNLDSAYALFVQFRTIPQSAAYVSQAQFHEDIISLLRSSSRSLPPEERAARLQEASMGYWILGFRTQAILTLRQGLRADPGFFAGNVFGTIYSLAVGDTAGAHEGVRLAERSRPMDPLTVSLRRVLATIDSLPYSPHKGHLECEIGRRFAEMGLFDMGIDQSYKALRYGDDAEALRLLADLYEKKERRGPALQTLRRLALLEPDDAALKGEIRALAD